ncbi:MAG TPA: hypothetical protein VGE54_07690 [Brevundimonas sp.]
MKRALSLLLPLAVLTLAAPAMAQTAPSSTSAADDITRELNGGPPASTLPARPPVTAPVTQPVTPAPAPVSTPPVSQPAARPVTTPTPPATRPAASPPAPASAAPVATSAPAPAVTATEPAAPPPPPPPTVLDSAAIAALPFTVSLPAGFEITTGRPGPDFKVYTVRRAGTPFVMIYAGPSALFPIYEGDEVEAAGRASILVTENGRRRALEHLFNRDGAPRQVHVWVASVEDADRDLAESIAQSVDVP